MIDADNTPYSQIKQILDESARYGRAIIKRAYGEWSKQNLNDWLGICNENAIKSIQLNRYLSDKNTTGLGMFVDAMDMLHRKEVDTFVLVSSDSDFTSLAIRIQEAGLQVVGIGQKTTPSPFINVISLSIWSWNRQSPIQKKFTKEQLEAQKLGRNLLNRALKQAMDESGTVSGAFLGEMLRIEPAFDLRIYGVRKLSDFVQLYPDLIKATGEKTGVDLVYQVNDKALKPDG